MAKANFTKSIFAFGVILGTFAQFNSAIAQSEPNPKPDLQTPVTLPSSLPTEYVRQKPGEILLEAPKADAANPTEAVPTTPAPVLPPIAPKPPTKAEIAKQIAPNYNTSKSYNRFVQCYGTADFMGAFINIRASAPNSAPQLKGLAASIAGLKAQMQPIVLATTQTVPATKFRTDYDKVARGIQNKIFTAPDFNRAIGPYMGTLQSCQADVNKWRGGK